MDSSLAGMKSVVVGGITGVVVTLLAYAAPPDPDIYLDARGLITTKGYPLEEHTVETADGYILSMHRIPRGIKAHGSAAGVKPAVYLQHGLLASSENWIMNMADQSLAFMLADSGYDVWMGNCRGSTYSRRHKTLSVSSNEFWQFSFHEMAMYDLPAMADYVAKTTGQERIIYVAHSQGGMIALIKFSQDPVWAAKRIRQFHALAPACFFDHISSVPLRVMAPLLTDTVGAAWRMMGVRELNPNNELMRIVSASVCSNRLATVRFMCDSPIMFLTVMSMKYMNETRMPVFVSHASGGSSTRNIVHFGQMVKTKEFKPFDHGTAGNQQAYGAPRPPQYNLGTFAVPTVLYTGGADSVVAPGDMQRLTREIRPNIVHHYIYSDATHLDFVWGLNGPGQIYPDLLREMQLARSPTPVDGVPPPPPPPPPPGPLSPSRASLQQLAGRVGSSFRRQRPTNQPGAYVVPTTVREPMAQAPASTPGARQPPAAATQGVRHRPSLQELQSGVQPSTTRPASSSGQHMPLHSRSSPLWKLLG